MANNRKNRNWLTVKEVQHKTKPGRYADGNGLYLVVGQSGSKSWEFTYDARRWGKKGKRYMGLGSVRDVQLARARELREEQRALIVSGIDPLEHRRDERHRRWVADAKNISFKAMADDFILYKSERAPKPWKDKTRAQAVSIIYGYLKPLHDLRCADITAKHIFDIVDPLRTRGPAMANAVLIRARTIFDWAIANEAMEGKANPASMRGRLRVLFGTDNLEPEHEHYAALDWHKVPALMARLGEFKPRTHYTVGEAARAVGITRATIYINLMSGRLVGTKPPRPVFPGSWQEWQIAPVDLFKVWDKVVDVIPGLPTVSVYLLQFLILNGSRFHEAQYMRWSEWYRDEQLWIIPWQRVKARNKAGQKEIRIDHVIPLSQRSINILGLLDEQRKRDKNDSEFVFGNYRTANNSSARIGQPICIDNARNLLRKLLSAEDAEATLHGMRTAFRSWGGAQRCFAEQDLECAIAHIQGHGKDALARLYNRQRRPTRDDEHVKSLIAIFDRWADFCVGFGMPADIVPFRRQAKQP